MKKKKSNLGDNIKKFRTSLELTQKALAKKFDVTQANVSQWESGKTSPSIKVLQQIKDLYPQINTQWFFDTPKESSDFFVDEGKIQLQKQIAESDRLKKEVHRQKELISTQEQEIARLRVQNDVLTMMAKKKLSK